MNAERQYAVALKELIQRNHIEDNRTGVLTFVKPHAFFHLRDVQRNFPILRGKKTYPYMALKEMLWMLQGRTDVSWLRARKVTYWDEWEQEDGTIGKSYGYQFRNFGGVDQVKNVVDDLLFNPESRRIIINLWNAPDLNEMALPPCLFQYQFTVEKVKDTDTWFHYEVSLHTLQRSCDSFLGLPYNFISASFVLMLFCDFCTKCTKNEKHILYVPKDVYHTVNNFHLYTNHLEAVKQYGANIAENKENVIDSKTSIVFDTPAFANFDAYLDYVDSHMKEAVKVEYEVPDQYGPIKADIAV